MNTDDCLQTFGLSLLFEKVEFHPYQNDLKLLQYCKEAAIQVILTFHLTTVFANLE